MLYVSCGFRVRPKILGCVAMGSAVLCIFNSRLVLYSARSGVNRLQVVLFGVMCRLLCFVEAKTLSKYGWMYVMAALVRVCRIFWGLYQWEFGTINHYPVAGVSWLVLGLA